MVEKRYEWASGATLEEHSRRKHKILREYLFEYLVVRCRLPQPRVDLRQHRGRVDAVDLHPDQGNPRRRGWGGRVDDGHQRFPSCAARSRTANVSCAAFSHEKRATFSCPAAMRRARSASSVARRSMA